MEGLEKKKIIDELSGQLGKDLFTVIYDEITEKPYTFLFINKKTSDINKKYFNNFETPININNARNSLKYYEEDEDTDEEDDE